MTRIIKTLIVHCFLSIASSTIERSYTVTSGKYFDYSGASAYGPVLNKNRCSLACLLEDSCVAVNYQFGTGYWDFCQILTTSAESEGDLTDHADREYLAFDVMASTGKAIT